MNKNNKNLELEKENLYITKVFEIKNNICHDDIYNRIGTLLSVKQLIVEVCGRINNIKDEPDKFNDCLEDLEWDLNKLYEIEKVMMEYQDNV